VKENCSSRTAQENSLQDPICKVTRAKWAGGVAQATECLLCKSETLSSKSNPTKRRKKKERKEKKKKETRKQRAH
jgi:hypothetical protein